MDSFDLFKNSEERNLGSLCWTAGGALSLRFITWHSLLHSAILDRLFLLPANSILCLWRRKKRVRQGRGLTGRGRESGWGWATDSFTQHWFTRDLPCCRLPASRAIDAASPCQLSKEQSDDWPMDTYEQWQGTGFWDSTQGIPSASQRIQTWV